MEEELTLEDIAFILESLRYTEKAFREYPISSEHYPTPRAYPSYEFKQERLAEVHRVQRRVKALKKRMKEAINEGSD